MKAVVCCAFGLEHTAVRDWPAPALTEDGVRIEVHAAGVSFANLLAIEGRHQNRAEPPFVPGTEVAGVVLECGPAVRHVVPGQRVMAAVRAGGFAQQVVAPERTVYALPAGISDEVAVQFPTIYGTAYAALAWRARLQPGETLLVHGAAGGSGLAAIEIGRVLGARVIATASTAHKQQAAQAHGAQLTLGSSASELREAVLQATGGRGADVVFDPVGGALFDESLRCIAPCGRLVTMGYASGQIPQVAANRLLVKNVDLIGLYWGYYLGWARQPVPSAVAEQVRAAFAELLDWTSRGLLKPRCHASHPLHEYREALRTLASREAIGRVALLPQRYDLAGTSEGFHE
ncbi:MAG: NADPH:quinone oxidoreductase family protein [Burkholderiales bacterium]|nr:NADPH:quinone oxidoreductase family protein [Burkholderiales bacterium]